MYNEKKRESLRIIEKKEEKVREMNDLLKRDIEPQMEKLRKVNKISNRIWAYFKTRKEKFISSGNQDKSSLKK